MTEPIITQTVEFIKGFLAEIQTANGFYTDAGANLYTEDESIPDGFSEPAFLIVAVGTPSIRDEKGKVGFESQIQIEALQPVGDGPPDTEPRKLGWRLMSDANTAVENAIKALEEPSDTSAPDGLISIRRQSIQLPRRESGSNYQTGSFLLIASTRTFFCDKGAFP